MAKEKFANPWKEFADRFKKYYSPPGAPSDQAIKVYRQHLKQAIKRPIKGQCGSTLCCNIFA